MPTAVLERVVEEIKYKQSTRAMPQIYVYSLKFTFILRIISELKIFNHFLSFSIIRVSPSVRMRQFYFR